MINELHCDSKGLEIPVVSQIKGELFMGNDIAPVAYLVNIINESRQNAIRKVNEELINMYWKVGEFLSKESEQAAFGDAYIG